MKKLIFPVILGISSFLYAGQDWTPFPIGPFGGLNDRDSSFAIPANQSQSLLNVDLTPGGKSVKKRHGYGTAFTLTNTTSAVHGVYDFFDANGNEVNLFFNDTKMTSSVNGAAATVIFTNGSNGATYQCADSLGFAYCANSARTNLIKTDGVTSTNVSGFTSTGTMVTTAVTRLAMAGFSSAPSRIDFSADTDFTTWGTGSLGTSAAQFTINAPGAKITHITYAFNRLMWFKDTSFGYILIGNQPAQSDWVIKTVAYDVGTNDNSSVYREGLLYFRGKDGHIYVFDGYSYQRLSREISGTIGSAQSRSQNQFIQTTSAEFGAGSFSPNIYADTITVSGQVQLTFPDTFSTYRDGNNSTKLVWTNFISSQTAGNGPSGTVQISTNASFPSTLNIQFTSGNNNTNSSIGIRSVEKLSQFQQGTTYHIVISSIPDRGSNASPFYFVLSSRTLPSNGLTAAHNLSSNFYFAVSQNDVIPGDDKFIISAMADDTADSFSVPSTTFSGLGTSFDLYIATNIYRLSVNGVSFVSGTHTWPNNQVYVYMEAKYAFSDYGNYYVDNFGVNPETTTYLSQVKNASNLTSWDTFVANVLNGGTGSNSFYIRSSTNSIDLNSSTPTWTSIISGNAPTISTGTYFQIRDDLKTSTFTDTPILYDFTQNWFEGSASDKAYATYFDDKIMWALTIGTGATTNNRILFYDVLNQSWLLYDIASNGFYIKANKLYFGSATSGYIFKYGDIENDNGSAINSYWKSKDFFGGDLFTTQELANISIAAKEVSNSSMTVTYTQEGSTSTVFTMPLTSSKAFINMNKNLPAGTMGSTFNVQFGNNAADQSWEVYGLQIGMRSRSWIPEVPH